MKYARETFAAIRDEVMPLLRAHWGEVAHYQDIPLDVDFEAYDRVEAAGQFHVFTARTEWDTLAGYVAFFVRTNAHYKGSLQAVQDVLFVDRQHRGQGGALILYAENELRAMGVQVVYQHIKGATPRTGRLMEKLGYEPIDVIYGKRLDGVS